MARAINSKGQIAGDYIDSANHFHGFLRMTDSTLTPFDAAGSTNTFASAINSEGQVVGAYYDVAGIAHGFLRNAHAEIY
jgi:hypothetical protein